MANLQLKNMLKLQIQRTYLDANRNSLQKPIGGRVAIRDFRRQ